MTPSDEHGGVEETESWLELMPQEGCRRHLRQEVFGRVGVVVDGYAELFPVNYAMDGDDIIFRSELEGLRTRLNNFQYHILLSQPTAEWSGPKGRLNREFVESKIKEPASNYFFICGPGPFMDAACQILSSLGVAPETIIQESFGSPPPSGSSQDPAITEPASTIEFVCSKKTHSARQGQTLLQAAEQCGVNIPSGCRQGQCGTCKVKLLAGAVSMDAEQGLPHDLKVQGYVLTCVGHAKGPVKLDV